jgi:hypothetical protein
LAEVELLLEIPFSSVSDLVDVTVLSSDALFAYASISPQTNDADSFLRLVVKGVGGSGGGGSSVGCFY